MTIAILAGAIALWGIVHSLLASLTAKSFLQRLVGGEAMRAYRILYNLFALISLTPVLWLVWMLPDHSLYLFSAPWNFFMRAGQGVAVLLLCVTLLQTDALSFMGLRQLLNGETPSVFVSDGFYRLVRHPLYLFGLIFLWLTPRMTLNLLIGYLALTAYLVIGAYFEERKLLREYGAAYVEYQARTPMFIPGVKFMSAK